MTGTLEFVRFNWRWLLFGFLGVFFGSAGQTFFVSFFVPTFQRTFDLGAGAYGSLYSAATVAAAFLLGIVGRLIDRMPIWQFAVATAIGLALSCVFIAVSVELWMFFLAILCIRLFGQGLMSHVASTSLAKKFDRSRGRALGIAFLGFGAGEIIFPQLAPFMLRVGWRWGWLGLGVFVGLTLLPTWFGLMRREPAVVEPSDAQTTSTVPRSRHHATLREVLLDFRYYLVLPGVFLPGLVLTALFLFQMHLANSKGWTEAWIARCFVAFAVSRAAASVLTGPVVDRYGAVRLFPVTLVPMAAGILVLQHGLSPHAAWTYLALCGLSVGIGSNIRGAFWAEVCGTRHLGSIRSFLSAGSVVATGLGAILMGQLLDADVSVVRVLSGTVWLIAFAILAAFFGCHWIRPR